MNELGSALKDFPKFLLDWVLGFVILILTIHEFFALFVVGVLLGFAVGPLWGIIFPLTLWVILRSLVPLQGLTEALTGIQRVAAHVAVKYTKPEDPNA